MSRFFCSPCDLTFPPHALWNIDAPSCPECAAVIEELEPPRLSFGRALTGEPTFMAAVAVAEPTYSIGCMTKRQAGAAS